MKKHIIWAWVIRNVAAIICWTVLAMHFDKWWLALLSVFFLSSIKYREDDSNG